MQRNLSEKRFRVWDSQKGAYITLQDYKDFGGIEVENDGTLTLSPRMRFLSNMMISPECWQVEQYIGKFDKNGIEICEGDVLRVPVRRDYDNQIKNKNHGYQFSVFMKVAWGEDYWHHVVGYKLEELPSTRERIKELMQPMGREQEKQWVSYLGAKFEDCEIVGTVRQNPEYLEEWKPSDG